MAHIIKEGGTGAGAMAFTVDVPNNPGRHYVFKSLTVHFSAAPTTSENLTITLDANRGAAWDTLIYSVDPSASSATDIVWYPDGWEWVLAPGDQIEVDFTNTDEGTWAVEATMWVYR